MHPTQVERLDQFTFNDMWRAITTIEAQQFLVQARLHSLTQLKPQARNKIMREMQKEAYPRQFSKQNAALTAKDLAEKLVVRAKNGR